MWRNLELGSVASGSVGGTSAPRKRCRQTETKGNGAFATKSVHASVLSSLLKMLCACMCVRVWTVLNSGRTGVKKCQDFYKRL